MIVALLVTISILVAFAAAAVFAWPFVDQDKLLEAVHAYYEERDQP